MNQKIRAQYRHRIAVNETTGWRDRLGNFLRRIADRVDGRDSLALEMASVPPVPRMRRRECVHIGLQAMSTAFKEVVREESCELILHEAHPELFADECIPAVRPHG